MQLSGLTPDEGHAEGAAVAYAVVTAFFHSGGAEHGGVEVAAGYVREWRREAGQAALLVRQRVPDDEVVV